MMGGGEFDPVCGFVESIVGSVASFVFFHAVNQGSVGLTGILGGELWGGYHVYGVRSELSGRCGLRLDEEVAESIGRWVGDFDVLLYNKATHYLVV